MGKRVIISESEKKNILSLYEQIKFPIPPPKNSILIYKKNPYKYDELSNARQSYSTKLKDGDMFYILGLLPDEYNEEKIINKMNDEFGKSLINKTIKDPTTNEVFTIKEYYPGNYPKIGQFKLDNNSLISMDLIFNQGKGNNVTIKIYESIGTFYIIPKLSEYYNDNFLDKLISNLEKSNIKNIPDEYFEIRKILIPQSDF